MMTTTTTHTVDVAELRAMLDDHAPVTVLDIRNAEDRAEWAIPGSLHVDAYEALKAGDPDALAKSVARLEGVDPVDTGLDAALELAVAETDDLFKVDGAGLMLLSEDGVLRYIVASDEPVSSTISGTVTTGLPCTAARMSRCRSFSCIPISLSAHDAAASGRCQSFSRASGAI